MRSSDTEQSENGLMKKGMRQEVRERRRTGTERLFGILREDYEYGKQRTD
jgi:hypothetical protein